MNNQLTWNPTVTIGSLMNSCNDEVIAVIDATNASSDIRRTFCYTTHFVGLDTYHLHKHKYNNPIVIVTESPHIDEFNKVNITDFTSNVPVNARPVNGVTGQNIMQYLVGLLENERVKLLPGSYPIIVINAIQKQCSLGLDTKISRTKNFIRLWPNGKNNLSIRFTGITPTLVINACTIGDFYIDSNHKESAYGANFNNEFLKLIENEINYSITNPPHQKSIEIYGNIDLSGMVMHVIQHAFSTLCPVYKPTHPSYWHKRAPKFQNINTNITTLYEK